MKKDLSLIAKGAGFYVVGFAVSKALAYLYRVLIARTLGPAEYGIFSIGVGIMGIALVFAALGLYQGIMHFVSVYGSTGRKENARGTILFSLKLQLLTSAIIAAILFFSADFLALTYFREAALGQVIRVFSLTLPCLVLTSSLMIVTVAFKKLEYKILVRNLLENLAKISFTGILLFSGFQLFGATVGLALSSVFAFFFSLYIVQKKVFPLFGKGLKSRSNARELLSYSWPLLAVGFFTILMASIDNVMLGVLAQAYDVGIYNVARPTANLLVMAPFAFGSLFLPIITGLYAQKKIEELKKMFKIVTRWMFALTFPCLLFTFLFSEEILSVMFGSEYALGAASLIILSAGVSMNSFLGPVRSILESIGKTRLIFVNTVISGFLNVALNLLLIPFFAQSGNGIIGAALATALSFILWELLALAEVFLLTGIHPYNKAFSEPTIAAIASIAVYFVIKLNIPYIPSFPFPLDFLILVALGTSFLTVYALLFILLRGLKPEDKDILKAVEKKAGLRIVFLRKLVKKFS